ALDVQHLFFLAEEVLVAQLDRGVAAAVQHQRAVAAEQARGVDPRTERTGELRHFRVAPEAFHRAQLYFCAMVRIELLPWGQARAAAAPIRFTVFVEEQGVPPEIELDEMDARCVHA